MSKKIGECAYCGDVKPLTKDHIPPRNIFPKPRSNDLITVPCCEECRVGWCKDDEYFRLAVTVNANVDEDPNAKKNHEVILRSLKRPEKKKFSAFVNESLGSVEVRSKAGIYLGEAPAIKIDKERIDRVSERIIRGLFYKEAGIPLPEEYHVKNVIMQQGYGSLIKDIPQSKFKPWVDVGDGQFSYTYAQTDEDPYSMVWLTLYYGNLPALGFTLKPKHLR